MTRLLWLLLEFARSEFLKVYHPKIEKKNIHSLSSNEGNVIYKKRLQFEPGATRITSKKTRELPAAVPPEPIAEMGAFTRHCLPDFLLDLILMTSGDTSRTDSCPPYLLFL